MSQHWPNQYPAAKDQSARLAERGKQQELEFRLKIRARGYGGAAE